MTLSQSPYVEQKMEPQFMNISMIESIPQEFRTWPSSDVEIPELAMEVWPMGNSSIEVNP